MGAVEAEGLHSWGFAAARVVAKASTTAATATSDAVASYCGYSSHWGSGFTDDILA
jgi:hypothetical protein